MQASKKSLSLYRSRLFMLFYFILSLYKNKVVLPHFFLTIQPLLFFSTKIENEKNNRIFENFKFEWIELSKFGAILNFFDILYFKVAKIIFC
jgi:hypothetical protein